MADYAFGPLRLALRHAVAPPFRLAPAGDLPVEAGQEWRAFSRAACTIRFMTNHTFKSGESREQPSLFPPRIEDYVGLDNPVRAIDSFVCALDLAKLGFRYADRRA